MAILATIIKSPDEVKRVHIDYDDWLDSTDTLSSADAEVTNENPDPNPLVPYAFISDDRRSVYLHLQDGNEGDRLNVLITTRTTALLVKEVCIEVSIKAPCA